MKRSGQFLLIVALVFMSSTTVYMYANQTQGDQVSWRRQSTTSATAKATSLNQQSKKNVPLKATAKIAAVLVDRKHEDQGMLTDAELLSGHYLQRQKQGEPQLKPVKQYQIKQVTADLAKVVKNAPDGSQLYAGQPTSVDGKTDYFLETPLGMLRFTADKAIEYADVEDGLILDSELHQIWSLQPDHLDAVMHKVVMQ